MLFSESIRKRYNVSSMLWRRDRRQEEGRKREGEELELMERVSYRRLECRQRPDFVLLQRLLKKERVGERKKMREQERMIVD